MIWQWNCIRYGSSSYRCADANAPPWWSLMSTGKALMLAPWWPRWPNSHQAPWTTMELRWTTTSLCSTATAGTGLPGSVRRSGNNLLSQKPMRTMTNSSRQQGNMGLFNWGSRKKKTWAGWTSKGRAWLSKTGRPNIRRKKVRLEKKLRLLVGRGLGRTIIWTLS